MRTLWLEPVRRLAGRVALPYSKSLTNRQLGLGAHTLQPFRLRGVSEGLDSQYFLEALAKVGYTIYLEGEVWAFIPPASFPKAVSLYLGEGGTTLRFLVPWLAHLPLQAEVAVAPSLARRPIAPLLSALRQAGFTLSETFPLRISGKPDLRPKYFSLEASLSSQFLSALFLAAPWLPEGATIELESRRLATPAYAEATRQLVAAYGWVWQEDNRRWTLQPATKPAELEFVGEADWSAGGYFFGWAALGAFQGWLPLRSSSLQPESQLFLALPLPYQWRWEAEGLWVESTEGPVPPMNLSVENCPDALLVLAVVAAFAEGPSQFRGIYTLPYKESPRLEALAAELTKVGARLEWDSETLCVFPTASLPKQPLLFSAWGDHRISMALSLLAARLPHPIGIVGADCVAKSFPTYWEVLRELGASLKFDVCDTETGGVR
ncbi:MAG: hypothetical protein NZ958_05985 [Bacteroidia bacterium]|nr:hypothetical protein [Bacteroidia bacterium]MDW8088832.1 hypothetical protein [Bacteroidia bacterium]